MNYLEALTDTLNITSALLEYNSNESVEMARIHVDTAKKLCRDSRHPKAIEIYNDLNNSDTEEH